MRSSMAMVLPRPRDPAKRPECPVCGDSIRPIEQVSGPDNRDVHFYCLTKARERATRKDDGSHWTAA